MKKYFLSILIILSAGYSHAQFLETDWSPRKTYDPRPLMWAFTQDYEITEGPFTFAIVGEAKNGCSANPIFKFLDQKILTDFTFTMGDMVAYPSKWENFKPLAQCSGWYFQKYPTWPVAGDQEGLNNYKKFYGLPTDSYSFELGKAQFIVLSYNNFNKEGGKTIGRFPASTTPVTHLKSKEIKTLKETLVNAKVQNKHVFVFTHAQFYSSGQGTKHYANNPPREIVELFSQNNVRFVFQADNSGYSKVEKDGVIFIRNSGAYGQKKPFFGLVEVDANKILYKAIDIIGTTFDNIVMEYE